MKKRAIFIIMSFTVLVFSGFIHGAIPASQRAALIALYNSTTGDSWYNNRGWKTAPLHIDGFALPGTEGSWFGVSVSGNNVKTLSLRQNNLNGTVPSQLGSLRNLQKLRLSENQLSGSIPYQLGNLSSLETLYLDYNQLSGSIPFQLGNLRNLAELDLNNNQLSGGIPYQLGNPIGNFSNLQRIDLSYNQLSGSIPSQLGNLNHLKNLLLDSNQLSGSIPSQLGNLRNLKELDLGSNRLSGGIPSQLSNLNNLQLLDLCKNLLSGNIPSSLTNLTNISYLDVGYNCLSAMDSKLKTWLNIHDPDWEDLQDQCNGGTTKPTVTTSSVSSITSTSAVCGGNVTSDGGATVTARGVCWSTITNPTIRNSKTENGSGTGSFTSNITGLRTSTIYYVRAYATNSKGTSYGLNRRFTTTGFQRTPEIGLNHTTLNFGTLISGNISGSQTILISNTGNSTFASLRENPVNAFLVCPLPPLFLAEESDINMAGFLLEMLIDIVGGFD